MAVCEKCKNTITIKSIDCSSVLAVEGNDEVIFFTEYLKYLDINNVEIIDVGGVNQFKTKIPALINRRDFSKVEKIAIIRDSDEDAESAFKSIKNIIKSNNLIPPENIKSFSTGTPKVGIYIMPDNENKGMLEDLCLKTIKEDTAFTCLESFFSCIIDNLDNDDKKSFNIHIAKRKAQVYLSTKKVLVNSIGLAAKKNYWDFKSSALDDLKEFIIQLK